MNLQISHEIKIVHIKLFSYFVVMRLEYEIWYDKVWQQDYRKNWCQKRIKSVPLAHIKIEAKLIIPNWLIDWKSPIDSNEFYLLKNSRHMNQ